MPVRPRLRAPTLLDDEFLMERITSRQNPRFKHARAIGTSVRERKKRHQLFMEGTRLIGSYAAHFGLQDGMLLVSENGIKQTAVQAICQSAPSHSTYLVTDELFAHISRVDAPEGIVCIAPTPRVEMNTPNNDFRILLEGVQDPGNLGGLLRTAAAAGASSVYLSKGCADAWSPKSLRGGMGAQFVLPLRAEVELASALADFRGTILSTSPRAQQTIYEVDLRGPVAMIFGNEGRGLRDDVMALANQLVSIPMTAGVESLNVAAAAAICCFERARQLRQQA